MALDNIAGQKNIADILRRTISNQRVAHAYIFAGPKGVGKAKMALEFAKALNCLENKCDACGICRNCKRIDNSNHQDILVIKPDGDSIKIDQIRELQKNLHYKTMESRYKIIIIEQAEQMTVQAANSLLKFLEEPNSPLVVILLAVNSHKLLPTIRSRCQILNFSHLDPMSTVQLLKTEGFKENDILIGAHLTNDLDEVRELLTSEQFALMRNLVIQWSEDISSQIYQALFTINSKIMNSDYIKEHLPQFLDLLLIWYRDILNIRLNRIDYIVYKEYMEILKKQALDVTDTSILQHMDKVLYVKKQIESNVNPQLALEQMVLSLWEGY